MLYMYMYIDIYMYTCEFVDVHIRILTPLLSLRYLLEHSDL